MKMDEDWRSRLFERIDADPRSDRAIALAAGLKGQYLHDLRSRTGAPAADKLAALCDALDVSLGYVAFGYSDDSDEALFHEAFAGASEAEREALRTLMRSVASKASEQG